MRIESTPLSGVLKIYCDVFSDERGFFLERFQERRFSEAGLPTRFAQWNHSRSEPEVLRGVHFQTQPWQGKLVGVTSGRVFDVAVDLRHDSPTLGKWYGTELTAESGQMLWIPKGFAHGFYVLGEEPADFIYLTDELYHRESDSGIHWNDPDLAIRWPIPNSITPKVSPKDGGLQSFRSFLKLVHFPGPGSQ